MTAEQPPQPAAEPEPPPKKKVGMKPGGTRKLAQWEKMRKRETLLRKRLAKKIKLKNGRPSDYHNEYAEQARKLALSGKDNRELCDFFCVSEATFYAWQKRHPKFLKAVKEGREMAVATGAESVFKRMNGYSHKAVHIAVNKDGLVTEVPYNKQYPPDMEAAKFFLTNRDPKHWSDKTVQEQTGPGGAPLSPQQLLVIQVPVAMLPQPKGVTIDLPPEPQPALPVPAAVPQPVAPLPEPAAPLPEPVAVLTVPAESLPQPAQQQVAVARPPEVGGSELRSVRESSFRNV